jgi:membrane-bound metal-dependent hydrolase YbcI (DUF457 family)
MDIIAHSLSGVLVGRIAMQEETGKDRIFYMGISIAALIVPDVDAISYIKGPDAFAMIHQRFTHTIFSLLLLPPLLAWIVYLFNKRPGFIRIYLLFLIGMGIHIAEDLIAHWPVQFFYPFSQKGWAFGLIRKDFSLVVDFIFIAGAMLTFYDPLVRYRREVALSTFGAVLLYLLLGPGW